MSQARSDQLLELLLEFGVNHIDTASGYGDSELRIAPWLRAHRDHFFVATKTAERTFADARAGICRSLERLQTDRIDLIQLHNLTDERGWQAAMGPGGALEAAIEARQEGLVRFIGVTGHGTRAAAMHLRSLQCFDFDSVLLPLNFVLMQSEDYAADFAKLLGECERRRVAVQTIKSVARRRWRDGDPQKRFSWYEPIREPEALRRCVHWVLSTPGVFLNTSSDARVLRATLEAARDFGTGGTAEPEGVELAADVTRLAMEPLFVRGVSDSI